MQGKKIVFGYRFSVNKKYRIKEMQDKNSIEYQVYSEKEIRYKERYKIKR